MDGSLILVRSQVVIDIKIKGKNIDMHNSKGIPQIGNNNKT
jgi:hypothetical protein